MRIIVHNYRSAPARPAFRAVAHDHAHAPGEECHCGGACDECKDTSKMRGMRDRFQRSSSKDEREQRGEYEYTGLAIDVVYMKGGYGRPKTETTRHYVRPNVLVDPRGYASQPMFVRAVLDANREHKAMLADGWAVSKIEGYYKK